MLRFVNLHYAPDVASTGQHLTDLAEYLATAGVPVEVITARGHYRGGRVSAPGRETRNGVRVRRLWSPGFGRGSRVGRVIDYAAFTLQLLWILCLGTPADGTILLTTPPLLAVVGWVARRLRGARYAIWSMDLHPDAEIAAGMLHPRGLMARTLTWLNDRGYRAAEFVVDLGPYMRRRIAMKGVAAERMHTVPVWGPVAEGGADAAERAARRRAIRTAWGVDDRCVVMYSGNAGIVHDFDAVMEAMRQLSSAQDVFFVFIGDGPRRAEIEAFARAHDLRQFAYHPYVPREAVGDTLAAADIHLITLKAAFAGIAVPGKLYGIMGAARPAVFIGPTACETADALRAADAGVVIDPASGDAAGRLVAAILHWRDHPAAAQEAGARGLAAYVSRYQPDMNCESFARILGRCWPAVVAQTALAVPRGARERACAAVGRRVAPSASESAAASATRRTGPATVGAE